MKKNTLERTLSVVLSLLMVVGLFSSIPVSAASDDGIIYNDDTGIPDPVLYNYLISEYDANGDGLLQEAEVDSITSLNISNYNEDGTNAIESLNGLNKLKNLKVLTADNNKLKDLNGIQGLELKRIYVSNNLLVDISAVKGMENCLQILNVKYNILSKLPDLKKFNNLTMLQFINSSTDFSYNKLSRKEISSKLPAQLSDWFNFWADYQEPDPENLELIDTNTGIKVQGTMDPDANLNVEKVESTVEDAVATYDITLRKDGDVIQPSGTITISIPSEIKDCKLFWVKDDGTKVEVNAIYENGNYVFTTDHLSVYALVKEPESTTVAPPETTVPEPTATEPIETTVPEPIATEPIETTVPVPTVTEQVETTVESATDKVEPTKSVATPDTPNNNSNSGSSSGSSSASINNSSIVATGDMLGASNLLLLSIIIMSATTGVSVILFRRKKEKVSNK